MNCEGNCLEWKKKIQAMYARKDQSENTTYERSRRISRRETVNMRLTEKCLNNFLVLLPVIGKGSPIRNTDLSEKHEMGHRGRLWKTFFCTLI
ncbi:hypothetical protein CapIbe_010256 [Capra ibex]